MEARKWNLVQLVDAVVADLHRKGFSEVVLKQYSNVWDRFLVYAEKQGRKSFSLELGQAFLEAEYCLLTFPKVDRVSRQRIRAIHILESYQMYGVIPVRLPAKVYVYDEAHSDIFVAFIRWRRASGISERTIRTNEIYLERFSSYLSSQGVTEIADLDAVVIQGFIRTLSLYNPPTIYCTLGCLRGLFRFLYNFGYAQTDFSSLVPSMQYEHRSKIPSAYSRDEQEAMVSQIDRGNPKGKRDYAMVLLAGRLGLRASDICGLCFRHIRWERNTIELVQEKTEKPLVLPLLNEVGEALIDYLKYGRPNSDLPYVFLKHLPPMDRLNPETLHSIVTLYLQRAGICINGRKHGPHALRHSLAGTLLAGNTPLPVISGILGHADTNSTRIYLKLNIVELRGCALEVPEFITVQTGGDCQ